MRFANIEERCKNTQEGSEVMLMTAIQAGFERNEEFKDSVRSSLHQTNT